MSQTRKEPKFISSHFQKEVTRATLDYSQGVTKHEKNVFLICEYITQSLACEHDSSDHTEESLDVRGQPLIHCQIVPHKDMCTLEPLSNAKLND